VEDRRSNLTTTFRPLSFEAGDWAYVKQAMPTFLYTEDVRGIVALRNDKIGAMSLLDNWSSTACNGHQIVTDRRVLVEGYYEEVWGWLFGGARRKKVLGFIPANNEPALRLAKRQGFVEVFRIADGTAMGIDSVIVEITQESCRYI
jgi:hypothetical protein